MKFEDYTKFLPQHINCSLDLRDITKDDAMERAREYGLEEEVKYSIENLGMTPYEALLDWDI